jgi:integrating conjugative element protein (TIGR03757 family)
MVKLRLVLMVPLTLFAGAAGAAEVLVFTDNAHPVTNTGNARVIFLDRVAQIEKELSVGLPGNIDDSERVGKDLFNSPEGAKKVKELTEAYQGLMQAWQMQVSKVPAVVVDGQYVVYGQPDVGVAVSIITKRNLSLSRGNELPTDTRPTLIVSPPKPTLTPKEESP